MSILLAVSSVEWLCVRCISVDRFEVIQGEIFKPPPLSNLEWPAILGAMGLGFCLSLLIFMDHNIAGAMVNSPDNGSVTQTFRPKLHALRFVVDMLWL